MSDNYTPHHYREVREKQAKERMSDILSLIKFLEDKIGEKDDQIYELQQRIAELEKSNNQQPKQ